MVRNNIDAGIICRVIKACQDKFLIPIAETQEELKNIAINLKQIKIKILNEDVAEIKTPLQPLNFNLEGLGKKSGTLAQQVKH